MPNAAPSPPPLSRRELIHEVNNYLSLVMTTSSAALDEHLGYDPQRALRLVQEGATELAEKLRRDWTSASSAES